MAHTITPKSYNFETKAYDEKEPVSIHELTSGMGIDEMVAVLSEWCNKGGKDFHVGLKMGNKLEFEHRTLQGLIGRLCLGILVGLGNQQFTDARNEAIVALGKQLETMINDGTLKMGYMI
jgi:hypothetical protein